MYFIEKNITRFHNLGQTYFLDPSEMIQVQSKFHKDDYNIYKPYPDSEKNILYDEKVPDVLLYEIKCNTLLRHQDILGTMYSLNIASDLFGDIIIIDDCYYIFILPIVRNYFETNFTRIRNSRIELQELPLSTLENYYRQYETIEMIVSSCRIDAILSNLLKVGRSHIQDYMKKKEILLNYSYLKKLDYKLKEGDIFSIRRIGKYRFQGIIKTTKQNHVIIEISKYL